jgi:hypothetical protein
MEEKDGRKYFAAAKSWEWVMRNGNMCFPMSNYTASRICYQGDLAANLNNYQTCVCAEYIFAGQRNLQVTVVDVSASV